MSSYQMVILMFMKHIIFIQEKQGDPWFLGKN